MDVDSIVTVASILGAILAVLSLIFIMPKKRRSELNGFFAKIHDIFNFKGLWLEAILKACYVFLTFYIIIYGFFFLFCDNNDFGENLFTAFSCIVLGPVLIRAAFELVMLFVLMAKNIMEINNKLGDNAIPEKAPEAPKAEAPKAEAPKAEAPKAERNAFCTGCGKAFTDNSDFCINCGTKRS